nr:MAG TPA: hypothetical protein [Caudoviricetes sp.]
MGLTPLRKTHIMSVSKLANKQICVHRQHIVRKWRHP